MNNLFVCHSQCQLILATGLANGRFENDRNDLILFVDFNISEDFKQQLQNSFSNVLFLTGTYPAKNKKWKEKLSRYPKDIKACLSFMNVQYDRLFLVCNDCIPEYYILRKAKQLNHSIDCSWLEDGTHPYYRNIIQLSGLSKYKFTQKLREYILIYILGFKNLVDTKAPEMGQSKILTNAYLTYPGKERFIFKDKNIIEISNTEYAKGLSLLYPPQEKYTLPNNSILIAIDKLDTYKNIQMITNIINNILKENINKNIYYKYHPREEDSLAVLTNYSELDKSTAIENYLASSYGKDISVIGIKSTSLQSAKKLGFKAISYAREALEANQQMLSFYESIGIEIK